MMFVLRSSKFICIYCLLVSAFIWAKDEPVEPEAKVLYKKETVVDFSEIKISGELMKPDGAFIKNRNRAQFDNLIELRSDFHLELIESLDDL